MKLALTSTLTEESLSISSLLLLMIFFCPTLTLENVSVVLIFYYYLLDIIMENESFG